MFPTSDDAATHSEGPHPVAPVPVPKAQIDTGLASISP
jgi:hypothetical protein